MADQSLTFWDSPEMGRNQEREATWLLPQCREGFIAVDTECGLHPDFPSQFLHICLSYPWGQVSATESEIGQWLEMGEQTW